MKISIFTCPKYADSVDSEKKKQYTCPTFLASCSDGLIFVLQIYIHHIWNVENEKLVNKFLCCIKSVVMIGLKLQWQKNGFCLHDCTSFQTMICSKSSSWNNTSYSLKPGCFREFDKYFEKYKIYFVSMYNQHFLNENVEIILIVVYPDWHF